LLAICLSSISIASEVEVQEPKMTLAGHYRSDDGRVKEHKFPVELKLLSDGKFTGISESWIEERLSNGTSHLSYFSDAFSGIWHIKDQTIHITVQKGNMVPIVFFKDINGLKIEITKKDS